MHAGAREDVEDEAVNDATAAVGTTVKTVPPVVAGMLQLFGHPLPEIVSAVTIIWLSLLIAEKLFRWFHAVWVRRK